jgi:hypothetical protein
MALRRRWAVYYELPLFGIGFPVRSSESPIPSRRSFDGRRRYRRRSLRDRLLPAAVLFLYHHQRSLSSVLSIFRPASIAFRLTPAPCDGRLKITLCPCIHVLRGTHLTLGNMYSRLRTVWTLILAAGLIAGEWGVAFPQDSLTLSVDTSQQLAPKVFLDCPRAIRILLKPR